MNLKYLILFDIIIVVIYPKMDVPSKVISI